jgi:L-ascorbate metabolism protein UlaG (beta-lactamase superfamily)
MGRFSDRATRPSRGPADILRWKVVDAITGRNRKDPGGFTTPRREHDRALVNGRDAQLTWIGHASFLFTLGGVRVLVDPLLRSHIGPIQRLVPPGIAPSELPPVDVVLVTHNHRDHLDPASLGLIGGKPLFVAPLGNGPLLRDAGATEVIELDWWQSTKSGPVDITCVPARHWSMRNPWDRNEMLWGGFVVRGPEGAVYHSGDTAFFDGFREIGERAGPIDWAMLPIGAYDPRWFMEPQHMSPEEAVEAARLLGARKLVAMHWGTFRLTDEPIGEPPERARKAFAERAPANQELWILDVGESRRLGGGD